MSVYRMLLFSAIASVMAVAFSLTYQWIYSEALLVDFSRIVSVPAVIGAIVFGTTFIFTAHLFLTNYLGRNAEKWLNVLLMIITFLSILPAFAATLPLETEKPALFPGMVVPMHFFPAMAFWSLLPFYRKEI